MQEHTLSLAKKVWFELVLISMTAIFKGTIYNIQCTIKLLLILLALIFTFYILHFTFIKPAFAQDSTPSAVPIQSTVYSLQSTVSPTSPLYTDLLVNNMFHTFSCLAIGQSTIGQPCLSYQLSQNAQGMIQGIPVLSQVNTSGGILGTTTNLIGILFSTPPIRTADYLASVGDGLGITKEAHAQGVTGSGAKILNPVLQLWQVSRNISYILLILIFLVIGLMVMFRNKINPQTVVTAQAALPGLVIGLIMITFSYFFAALLVDTAFIGTNLVGAYFSAAQTPSPDSNLADQLKQENVLSIMSRFVGATGQGDLHGAVSNLIDQLGVGPSLMIRSLAGFLAYQYGSQYSELPVTGVSAAGCSALAAVGTINLGGFLGVPEMTWSNVPSCIVNATQVGKQAAGAAAMLVALADPSTVASWALYVILIAILIYTMFKLLFRLVNNFISIIFYTIFAPFQFLVAALPGRQGLATSWMLNMLSNILVFPAVIGVFYFVNFLFGSEAAGLLSGKPPFPVTGGPLNLTGEAALPLFGGMGINFIRFLLAYGLLLATPSIPDIIGRAMGRANQAGQLIGQEISGGSRAGQQYLGRYTGGLQAVGTGITGQRQWTYNPSTDEYEYKRVSPGLGEIVSRGIGRIRGGVRAGREAGVREEET